MSRLDNGGQSRPRNTNGDKSKENSSKREEPGVSFFEDSEESTTHIKYTKYTNSKQSKNFETMDEHLDMFRNSEDSEDLEQENLNDSSDSINRILQKYASLDDEEAATGDGQINLHTSNEMDGEFEANQEHDDGDNNGDDDPEGLYNLGALALAMSASASAVASGSTSGGLYSFDSAEESNPIGIDSTLAHSDHSGVSSFYQPQEKRKKDDDLTFGVSKLVNEDERKRLLQEVRRLTLAIEEHRLAAVERAGEVADLQTRSAKEQREAQRKISELQISLEESEAKAKRLERDRSEREYGGHSSRSEAASAIDRLRTENTALLQRVTSLERECERNRSESDSRQENLRSALEKAVANAASIRAEDAAAVRSELTAIYSAQLSAAQRTQASERQALESECERLRNAAKEREEWWQMHVKERALQMGAEAKQDRATLEEREQLLQRLQQQERHHTDERIQSLRAELDLTRKDLSQEREERSRLSQQLRSTETELTKLRVRTEELDTLVASLRADLATSDEGRRELMQAHTRELAAQQRAITLVEQNKEEAIAQLESKLRAAKEAWNKERADLQSELQSSILKREEIERSGLRDWARSKEEVERREVGKRRTDRELWRKERDAALLQQAQEHQVALQHSQHRYVELEKVCKDLREHCEALRSELSSRGIEHASEMQLLRSRVDDLIERELRAKEEIRQVELVVQQRTAEASLSEAERRRAEARLADQLEEVKRAYKGQSSELRAEQERLERAHHEREQLLLREHQQRIERIERQAVGRENELRDRIADLSESLNRAQVQLQHSQVQAQSQQQINNLLRMQEGAPANAVLARPLGNPSNSEEKLRLEQKKRLEAAQAFELTERALNQRLEDARLAAMRESAAAAARLQAVEEAARKDREALQAKFEQAESECTSSQDALTAAHLALEKAAETRRSLERELERTKDSHIREIDRVKALNSKDTAHAQELAMAAADAARREHQQQLRIQQQESRAREQALEDRVRALIDQLSQLKLTLDTSVHDRAQLAESLALSDSRAQELDQARLKLLDRIKEIQNELSTKEKEIERLMEQSSSDSRESQRRLNALSREHQLALTEAQGRVADSEKSIQTLTSQAEELRNQIHKRELQYIRDLDESERSREVEVSRIRQETRAEIDRLVAIANERAARAEANEVSERSRAEAEKTRAASAEQKLADERKIQISARYELQKKYTRLLRRLCSQPKKLLKIDPLNYQLLKQSMNDVEQSQSADESFISQNGLPGDSSDEDDNDNDNDGNGDDGNGNGNGQDAGVNRFSRRKNRSGLSSSIPRTPSSHPRDSHNQPLARDEVQVPERIGSSLNMLAQQEVANLRLKITTLEAECEMLLKISQKRDQEHEIQKKRLEELLQEERKRANETISEQNRLILDRDRLIIDLEHQAIGERVGVALGIARIDEPIHERSAGFTDNALAAVTSAANAAAALASKKISQLESELAICRAKLEAVKADALEEAKKALQQRRESETMLRGQLEQAEQAGRQAVRKIESEMKHQIAHMQASFGNEKPKLVFDDEKIRARPHKSQVIETDATFSLQLEKEQELLLKATQNAVQQANTRVIEIESQLFKERQRAAEMQNALSYAESQLNILAEAKAACDEQLARHNQLILELKAGLTETEERAEEATRQRDQVNGKLNEVLSTCGELKSRIEVLMGERDAAIAEVAMKLKQIDEERSLHQKTKVELETRTREFENAREAIGLAKAEALAAGLTQTVKERERLLRVREGELNEVRAELTRLTQQLVSEEERRARMEREVDRLKSDVEEAKTAVRRERERLDEAESQHQRQSTKLDDALKQALAKQREEEALRDKAERELRVRVTEITGEARQREEEAMQKVHEAESRAQAQADRVSELQELVDAARIREKQVNEVKLEASVSQSKVNALMAEQEAMRTRIEQLRSSLKSEQEESERQRTIVQQLQASAERSKAQREAEVNSSHASQVQLEARIEERERSLAETQLREQRAQNELRRLTEKLASAEAELETVQSRLLDLRDSEESRTHSLYSENTKLQIELQELKSGIRSLENDNSRLKLVNDDLLQRLQQVEIKSKSLEVELNGSVEQRAAWTREKADLQRTAQELKTQLEHNRNQLQVRTDELTDMRSRHNGILIEKETLERSIESLKTQVQRAGERAREKYEEELSAYRVDGTRASQEQEKLIAKLRSEAKSMREEHEVEREKQLQKIASLNREIEESRTLVMDLKREIEQLRAQSERERESANSRVQSLASREKELLEDLERERVSAAKEAAQAADEARLRVAQVEQQLHEASERATVSAREADALLKKFMKESEEKQQMEREKAHQLSLQVEELEIKTRKLLAEERNRADAERNALAEADTRFAAQLREARAEQKHALLSAQAAKDEAVREKNRADELQEVLKREKEAEEELRENAAAREIAITERFTRAIADARAEVGKEAENELQRLHEKLEDISIARHNAEQALLAERKRLGQSEAARESLNEELKSKMVEVHELRERDVISQERAKKLQADKVRLVDHEKTSVSQLQKEINSLQKNLSEAQASIVSAEHKIALHVKEIERYKQQVDQKSAIIQQLEKVKHDNERDGRFAQTAVANAEAETRRLMAELVRANADLSVCEAAREADHVSWQRERTEIAQQYEASSQRFAERARSLTKELEQREAKLQQQTEEITKLTHERERLIFELNANAAAAEERLRMLGEQGGASEERLRSQLAGLERDNALLRDKVVRLEHDVERAQSNETRTKAILDEKEKEIEQISDEMQEMKSDFETKKEEWFRTHDDLVRRLRIMSASSASSTKAMSKQLEELSQRHGDVLKSLIACKQQRDQCAIAVRSGQRLAKRLVISSRKLASLAIAATDDNESGDHIRERVAAQIRWCDEQVQKLDPFRGTELALTIPQLDENESGDNNGAMNAFDKAIEQAYAESTKQEEWLDDKAENDEQARIEIAAAEKRASEAVKLMDAHINAGNAKVAELRSALDGLTEQIALLSGLPVNVPLMASNQTQQSLNLSKSAGMNPGLALIGNDADLTQQKLVFEGPSFFAKLTRDSSDPSSEDMDLQERNDHQNSAVMIEFDQGANGFGSNRHALTLSPRSGKLIAPHVNDENPLDTSFRSEGGLPGRGRKPVSYTDDSRPDTLVKTMSPVRKGAQPKIDSTWSDVIKVPGSSVQVKVEDASGRSYTVISPELEIPRPTPNPLPERTESSQPLPFYSGKTGLAQHRHSQSRASRSRSRSHSRSRSRGRQDALLNRIDQESEVRLKTPTSEKSNLKFDRVVAAITLDAVHPTSAGRASTIHVARAPVSPVFTRDAHKGVSEESFAQALVKIHASPSTDALTPTRILHQHHRARMQHMADNESLRYQQENDSGDNLQYPTATSSGQHELSDDLFAQGGSADNAGSLDFQITPTESSGVSSSDILNVSKHKMASEHDVGEQLHTVLEGSEERSHPSDEARSSKKDDHNIMSSTTDTELDILVTPRVRLAASHAPFTMREDKPFQTSSQAAQTAPLSAPHPKPISRTSHHFKSEHVSAERERSDTEEVNESRNASKSDQQASRDDSLASTIGGGTGSTASLYTRHPLLRNIDNVIRESQMLLAPTGTTAADAAVVTIPNADAEEHDTTSNSEYNHVAFVDTRGYVRSQAAYGNRSRDEALTSVHLPSSTSVSFQMNSHGDETNNQDDDDSMYLNRNDRERRRMQQEIIRLKLTHSDRLSRYISNSTSSNQPQVQVQQAQPAPAFRPSQSFVAQNIEQNNQGIWAGLRNSRNPSRSRSRDRRDKSKDRSLPAWK